MPPTKESLAKLCMHMNLKVLQYDIIEGILKCRGLNMEHEDPEDF